MPKSALILKFGAIGDVVMAVPAAHLLHRKGMRIDWVCGQAVRPLLECYPWINVVPVDDRAILQGSPAEKLAALGSLWRLLAGSRYDLCATLYYDERYRLFTLPIRATTRVDLSRIDRKGMLVPGRHHTDEYARILLQAMNLGMDGYSPQSLAPVRPDVIGHCPLPREGMRRRVALVPGGARNMLRDDALRRWPLNNYVSLADMLLSRGYEVLLVGSPEDHWVDSSFGALPVTNLIGTLSLPELIALFDETDVVVSHDTGPLHLAGITHAAVLGIFGPTNPWEKFPQREYSLALWGGEGFACRPCYDGKNFAPCQHNGCMHQISPEMVLRELEGLLERKALGTPSPARVMLPEVSAIEGWANGAGGDRAPR